MLPFIKFLGHLSGLLYIILESLLSGRAIRLLIAAIVFKTRGSQWGASQWLIFNLDTAAFVFNRPNRTVSGLAEEFSTIYPRYKFLKKFIDLCSEEGHCKEALEKDKIRLSSAANMVGSGIIPQ